MKLSALSALSLAVCASLSAHAAETLATSAATLELTAPACEFAPQLFLTNWECKRASGGLTRNAAGEFPFTLAAERSDDIRGTATFSATSDGGVEARYTFVPARDVALNSLFVGASLPSDTFAGGIWKTDQSQGPIPLEHKELGVMYATARALTLTARDGKQQIALTFAEPTSVMIQDDRQWGPTFSVRIGHNGGTRTFKANAPYTVAFTLATQEPQKLILDEPVTIRAGADWIPLKDETDILPGSALDFTALRLTEAPAGKYGRVIANGPHFEFEKKPGVPQRFYGVNLCFSANYLKTEDSARLVARLARTGYNAVRLHHYDDGLAAGSKDGTTLNPDSLARLDALMTACVSNGLYVTTDLFVSRNVPWRSVGIDRDGMIAMNAYKALVPVHESAMQNLQAFARQLLTHVNPHTGRRYADEPALAWLAMINEGNFGNYLDEMRDLPEWRQAWQHWLADRRAQDPKAYEGVPDTLPNSIYESNRHVSAFVLFLKETEDRMIARLKAFLRDEIKCRALITDRSSWTNFAPDQATRSALFDYVDDHFYVDHPQFLEHPWSLPSKCANDNPIKNSAMASQPVVFTRLLNKPFTVTEYNYAAPGRFRGVGGILTGALGALQDWGGIWRFAYGHNGDLLMNPAGYAMNYFDMAGDPLSLAAERASICLFLRGDLPALRNSYALLLPPNELLRMRDYIPQNHTDWSWLAWYARMGTLVADAPSADIAWSGRYPEVYGTSSAEIRKLIQPDAAQPLPAAGAGAVALNRDSGAIVLKTPRTCGGFTESGPLDAGDLAFDVGGTAATVWVSSLDDQAIPRSSHLLLTHLTDVQNSGTRYAQQSRRVLLEWGTLPHLVRNGQAEIRLALDQPNDYNVYVLATGGRRIAAVPTHSEKGRLVFTASVGGQPETAVLLYEIVRKPAGATLRP